MNWLIFAAGVLAAFTALLHIFVGGRDIARPLLASELSEEVKLTVYGCWHIVTVYLVISAVSLLVASFGLVPAPESLVAFISASWVLFGLLFVAVTLGLAKPRGIFRFPQWALLIPVGMLGFWGLA